MLKPARTTDGKLYEGNQQFKGQGIMRSCGKCGVHSLSAGFKKHPLWGMIGLCCQKERK